MVNIKHVAFTASQRGITDAQVRRLSEELVYWANIKDQLHCHLGDCIGGDTQIYHLCKGLSLYLIGHPGDNPKKRSFLQYDEEREVKDNLLRNHDMVEESTLLFACPRKFKEVQRSGTWATWRYAKMRHKAIYRIDPNGDLHEP